MSAIKCRTGLPAPISAGHFSPYICCASADVAAALKFAPYIAVAARPSGSRGWAARLGSKNGDDGNLACLHRHYAVACPRLPATMKTITIDLRHEHLGRFLQALGANESSSLSRLRLCSRAWQTGWAPVRIRRRNWMLPADARCDHNGPKGRTQQTGQADRVGVRPVLGTKQ